MSTLCLLSWMGLILSASDTSGVEAVPAETYGHAVVSQVLSVDQTCTLYCNIKDFPPIIGENMPVMISGLKTANTAQYNEKLQVFLFNLLLGKKETPKQVRLRHLRRGESFCFVADVEIDGQDLCDLLVENGLAQRVIKVNEPAAPPGATRTASSAAARTQKAGYMASKTSKIFHRAECVHAKRMDTDKAVYFSTRQEAERTGRQACKTCKP